MTINLYLNNDPKSKNSEKIIFAYIRGLGKGKTIVLHTGERINPKYWNTEKQQVKKSYTGSPELNSYLIAFVEEIKKTIRLFLTDTPNAEFEDVKHILYERFKRIDKKNNFFEVFNMFIEIRKGELSNEMIKKYNVLRNHLKHFSECSKIEISFNNMDLLFFDQFSNYLLNEKKLTNNTIHKIFSWIKTFLTWCKDRNIHVKLDYMKYKSKQNQVDIIYLNEIELMKIYNLKLNTKPALEKVRDTFCFACFTGQRFSDVTAMKRDDIKGKLWHSRVIKTKEILKIPLNYYAIEILNKYSNQSNPLPVISSQKTNVHLKELCKLAEINDPIQIVKYRGSERIEETFPKYDLVSFHTARRTFVTLSLEKGMRPETVMEITGHKDYKTFKKYIKITSKVKAVEMDKIWKKEPELKLVNG